LHGGIGLLLRGWKVLGAVITAMSITGPALAVAINWPSAATLEAYGIAIVDAWVALMLRVHAAERS